MNPWGFLVILLGIVCVIIGVKGSQHNIAAAITGNAPASPNAAAPAASGSAPASSPASGKSPGKQLPLVTNPLID